MAELKTRENDGDVISFLNKIENEQRRRDCFELLEFLTEITGEKPKMWGPGIVGFGNYHYKYESGREGDWFLIGFSPRKQNLTIYIMSGFKILEDIMHDLGKYKTGSSCLYVKKLSDIDKGKFKLLVERSNAYMKKIYPVSQV
jgi:hypothetical protein